MRIGTSLVEVGQYNEKVVLNALRRLGPASQRDIAASTQLSVQTVSAIVRHLLSIDVLREIGTDFRGRGRPHVIVDLVPEAAYSIGVHVDPAVTSLVMLDMKGRVVASSDSDEPTLADPVEAMKQTAGRIRELVERTGVPEDRIVGVCMAVPGVVDVANGSLRESVWLPEWQDAPLGALLAEGLGAEKPIPVVKDTISASIGECWVRGGGILDSTMVFVYLGAGIGLGLAVDGEPLAGASGNSGEVGTILKTLGMFEEDSDGGLDNDPALLVERAHGKGAIDGDLPPRADHHAVREALHQVCDKAENGNQEARDILQAAAQRIATLTVGAVELIDADLIVLGGPYFKELQPYYQKAVEDLLAESATQRHRDVQIMESIMDEDAGAIGAAAVVLDRRYTPRSRRTRMETTPAKEATQEA
ncbi:MAG: ROK family transcriptional regulator [Actinomyces sp.]|jgi:predicted NBD/HSP70 family sugar kinase|nr:ROK family transcriptional regulator [Actinomyces sp.]